MSGNDRTLSFANSTAKSHQTFGIVKRILPSFTVDVRTSNVAQRI